MIRPGASVSISEECVPQFRRELRAHHKTSEIVAEPSPGGFAIGLRRR